MRYRDIVEATMDKPWAKDVLSRVENNAQERFQALKSSLSVMGSLGKYEILGSEDWSASRYYVVSGEELIGYLLLNSTGVDNLKYVAMVFVRPKFQRGGIALGLYRFALSRGITIMSDATFGSLKRDVQIAREPRVKVSVTMVRYDRHDGITDEKPVSNASQAFRQRDRRLIARPSTMLESFHPVHNEYFQGSVEVLTNPSRLEFMKRMKESSGAARGFLDLEKQQVHVWFDAALHSDIEVDGEVWLTWNEPESGLLSCQYDSETLYDIMGDDIDDDDSVEEKIFSVRPFARLTQGFEVRITHR